MTLSPPPPGTSELDLTEKWDLFCASEHIKGGVGREQEDRGGVRPSFCAVVSEAAVSHVYWETGRDASTGVRLLQGWGRRYGD